MKLFIIKILFIITLGFYSCYTQATEYLLPDSSSRLIGEHQSHVVVKGEYFQQLAEQYNVGFLALMSANPGVDPFLPEAGKNIIIPTAMLLPYGERQGIVINLPELRLYYYSPEQNKVFVFPVGIGQEGLPTPNTTTFISDKRKNPTWRPTIAMRERYFKKNGKHLAKEVPAGANNPFGKYALRLGNSVYLIHGTNQRFGVGMRASSGCVRMYDDDIKWLFDNVAVNTSVKIINQPIKMSYEKGQKQLIEVHSSLAEENIVQDSTVENLKNVSNLPQSVRRFVGKNSQFLPMVNQLIAKPKGLVVELGSTM